ncbi:MAG: hypothetical protein KAU17_08365 [Spirochaetales bacterium]|nr:hypothetical protein [Spirochaetales bacterium]
MKRIIFALIILLFAFSPVFAESDLIRESPLKPVFPEVIAQGGAFTAVAEGYAALFTNPAGFARGDRGELTIVSANPWMYARPDKVLDLVNGMTSGTADETAMISLLNEQVTTGGFGIGMSGGVGWVGNGLGLGLITVIDSYMYGNTLLGIEGDLTFTTAFIAGLAFPLELFGIDFIIGGDVRPMVRIHSPMPNDAALGFLMGLTGGGDPLAALQDAYHGTGIGFDLGATADIGPFTLGLSIRDLFGTRFFYSSSPFADIIAEGSFPEGTDATDGLIPMEINLGFAYHPDLGSLSKIIDPRVQVDLQDFIGVIRDKRSVWTLLHIGGEVKFLRFLKVWGGFNQGYITLGAGAHLLIFDISAALFTQERGRFVGDRPNSGATIELSFRI